ncbi:MAG: MarR family transcriptional regulator [Candidatus Cohnella colombiensis]|uniref:MarR family transcriptional regulator n=1 Tax=Candidatus Cohnella colombiensis TaxID=3121368 RepID=A0AA95JBY8_9BACL|nr:MAG: MarR family transcriptional regulator [Cohnella sp.]
MVLDQSVGFLINITGRKITHHFATQLSAHEITPEQWSVLSCLCEQDGISQKSLAARVVKDPTNITRILDQLERKGLALRRTNPVDRRSFSAFVTDKGNQMQAELSSIEEQFMNSILQGLSEQQIDQLKQTLIHIVNQTSNINS